MSISGTINRKTESASYTYDNVGRLVTSSQTTNGASAQRRFAYDRWGNRTGVWDATSGGNQIQSIALQQSSGVTTNQIQSVTAGSTLNYTYDAAGNVTNDGAHNYNYDAENRLVSVDSGSTVEYRYDYRNCRVKKTVGSRVTHSIWESGLVLCEYNVSTGAQIIDYVYSGSRLIAEGAGSTMNGSGLTTFLLRDRLSIRVSLDKNGNLAGRQGHLPFGEDFEETGSQEKHHFTSYERDVEIGSDYAVNRQCLQNAGRFMSADHYRASGYITDPQSWNRYSYTGSDPVNYVDPSGQERISVGNVGTVTVTAGSAGAISNEVAGSLGLTGRLQINQDLGGEGTEGGNSDIPPCPKPDVPKPGGTDLDANIQEARKAYKDFMHTPGIGSPLARLTLVVTWFVDKVKPGGVWDYKTLQDDYEKFGNVNYGAVGQALGFSLNTLQRAAGWMQEHRQQGGGENAPGFLEGLIQILTGVGGQPPYGDHPEDSQLVGQGFQYAEDKANGKCK